MNAPETVRFEQLSDFLHRYRYLWEPRPFEQRPVSWEAQHPKLGAWLRSRTLEELEELEQGETLSFEPLRSWQAEAEALTETSSILGGSRPVLLSGYGMRARKHSQVQAFLTMALGRLPAGAAVVDWCAGKGHLGRALARHGFEVTCVENQAALVERGRELAESRDVGLSYVCANVCDPSTADVLGPGHWGVALHACGKLTDALLRAAVQRSADGVLVAPCCYHILEDPRRWVPLSAAGRARDLELNSGQIRLATSESVVASPSRNQRRFREMAWRLGYDLVLRELSGVDRFHTVPRLPRSTFHRSFEDFCVESGASSGWNVPRQLAIRSEPRAWEEMRIARALALVRLQFRRPLEMWAWLDKCLYLQEAGWKVQGGTFCERTVSPRNLLIAAVPSH